MATREELVSAAKQKYRQQLVDSAKAKWASQNAQVAPRDNNDDLMETGARSMLEGATLGASEPVISGINAVLGAGIDRAMVPGASFDIESIKKEYDRDVERRRRLEKENPKAAMVGEIGGAIAPSPINLGSAVAKGAAGLVKGITEATPIVGEAVKAGGFFGGLGKIGQGAAEGAAMTVGAEGIKRGIERPTGFIQEQDKLEPLMEGAESGALFGGALSAIPQVGKALKFSGKKMLSSVGGVNEENINAYLARPQEIEKAKSMEEIKDLIDSTVGKLHDDVHTGKINLEQANEALKESKKNFNEGLRNLREDQAIKKADIRDYYNSAKEDLENAFKQSYKPIENVKAPVRLADEVLDAVAEQKQKVSNLSEQAYKTLDREGSVDIGGIQSQIKEIQESLKIPGESGKAALIGDTAKEAYSKLQGISDDLSELGSQTSLRSAKKLIQNIDRDIKWSASAGGFNDASNNAFMQVRRALDEKLKQIPEYAKIMDTVADETRLLVDADKMFGKRENALSKLANIDSEKNVGARQLLDRLGSGVGRDFKTPLMEYMGTLEKQSPEAQQVLRESLPQYGVLQQAENQYMAAQRPEFNQVPFQKFQERSPEAMALSRAQGKVGASQEALEALQATTAPFAGITPNTSENYIRSVMRDSSIERREKLKALSGMIENVPDQDVLKMIKDLQVKEAFDAQNRQGSANVNFWALLSGAATGIAATGDISTGLMGAGGGAVLGKLVDFYGPAMTKQILKATVKIQGIPTVKKIEAAYAGFPAEIREQLKQDLVRTIGMNQDEGIVPLPPLERPDARAAIQDSSLLNLEKAKAISGINKDGSIDSGVYKRVMLDGYEARKPNPSQNAFEQRR